MLITLTELGPGKYKADFLAHGRRRRYLLTLAMRDALKARGNVVWSTARFGKVEGGQRQYEVRRK